MATATVATPPSPYTATNETATTFTIRISVSLCVASLHVKRRRFSASSLRDSSLSSPSLSSSYLSTDLNRANASGSSRSKTLSSEGTAKSTVASALSSSSSDEIGGRKGALTFNSLFGKQSIWRRMVSASKKARVIFLLNAVTIVNASTIPVVKEVEAIMDPSAFTVVRFFVSAIPFIPFVLRAWDDVPTRRAGIELGFWVSLGYLMEAIGLLTSDAGRASFLSMFTIVVVPLLDGMLGAIIPARTWFGALMSLLGVAMLESSGSSPCIGDLLNFLSAVFFGIHMLRTEHISRSTTKRNFLPLLGYEVCVVAVSSALWYLIGGAFNGKQNLNTSSSPWSWDWMLTFPWIPALYTGIFSTGLCLWIEMTAMCDISATETAIIYGLEPVWGAGFAWFLLGERWGTAGWIGAALVLAGSLMVQILGSSPSTLPKKGKESGSKIDSLLANNPKRQNRLSAAPVTVNAGKDVPKLLKK